MLNSLVNFFTAHIPYWPLVCFSLLILAGFNLPVSEDAVIVLSAGVTLSDSSLVIPTWISLYLGIFISDIMVYWWGYFLSKGMFQFKKIRKKLTENKIRLVAKTLDDYGFRTFIVCRFIPFGVRNTLWMSFLERKSRAARRLRRLRVRHVSPRRRTRSSRTPTS